MFLYFVENYDLNAPFGVVEEGLDVSGDLLFRKYAVQYLLLKTLDRESRKEILKERPSGEFLEMLNQVYAVTAQ